MKIIYIFFIVFLSACSVNKLFYVPTKIPKSTKQMTVRDWKTKDTTVIFFNENLQPTFTNAKKEPKDVGCNVKSYCFKSTSGNMINAWLLTPHNMIPKTTILYLHGNAGNIIGQSALMVELVKRGFQAFAIDYSGFGFSTGKPTRKNVLLDARSSLDYLKTLPETQGTKFVIYGQSLGGHLSAVVAVQEQSKIDALVIEGAFSSHKDVAKDRAGLIGKVVVKEAYPAKEMIKKYAKPLLIIHSSEDKSIPIDMGKTIYNNANSPKSFYEIKKRHVFGPLYYPDSIAFKINQMIGL